MNLHHSRPKLLSVFVVVTTLGAAPATGIDPGCRTGGRAAADAYILSNPFYAYYFGDLQAYVNSNREHFGPNGDAIRCLIALSKGLMASAIQLYDPRDAQRRQEIDAEMESMGMSRGKPESTPSGDLFAASIRLSRLARTLPAGANGDWAPYGIPANEMEQMQMVAERALIVMLGDQTMLELLAQMEPMIKELANLEHRGLLQAAERLASSE